MEFKAEDITMFIHTNNKIFYFLTDSNTTITVRIPSNTWTKICKKLRGEPCKSLKAMEAELDDLSDGARIIEDVQLDRALYNNYGNEYIQWNDLMIKQYYLSTCISVTGGQEGQLKQSYWLLYDNIILNIKKLSMKGHKTNKIRHTQGYFYIDKLFGVSQDTLNKLAVTGKKNLTENEIEALSKLKTTIEFT
jgi:hypothetical protein